MSICATILVSSPASARACNPLIPVQKAASELEASGFRILSLDRSGVRVRADWTVYQSALGLVTPPVRDAALDVLSPLARLVGLVSGVTLARAQPC